MFYRWRRQSAHKAKNLKNAAAFNRINTVVEMFSSGYINSTGISCRPTSIGRLSRCTLQSRVETKLSFKSNNLRHFGQVTAKHLVSGSSLTLIGNFYYLYLHFLTSIITKRPTVSFPIIRFLYFYSAERKSLWT